MYRVILVPFFLDYSYEHLKKEQNPMFLKVDIK